MHREGRVGAREARVLLGLLQLNLYVLGASETLSVAVAGMTVLVKPGAPAPTRGHQSLLVGVSSRVFAEQLHEI